MAENQQPLLNDILTDSGDFFPAHDTGDLTGGLPINLDSLRDGPPGSKPFYPYSTLIRYAIKGSPNQKLLLEDIYYAIESRFPYFRTAPSGWKNSVRHNLSLNPCFEKVPRPLTDRGKGSYWIVNDHVDPRTGVHRIRKKKSKKGAARGAARQDSNEPQDVDYHPPEQGFEPQQFPPPPPMHGDGGAPASFTPTYPPPFDPTFQMIPPGMTFFPPLPVLPGENLEDENGHVDWKLQWLKELGQIQNMTAEQDKAGVSEEWYRMMFYRVRTALMTPVGLTPDGMMHGMSMGPPPPPPPHQTGGSSHDTDSS